MFFVFIYPELRLDKLSITSAVGSLHQVLRSGNASCASSFEKLVLERAFSKNGKDKKLSVKVTRKDPNRGPQNQHKYILQQKYVVAGKKLPYTQQSYFIFKLQT